MTPRHHPVVRGVLRWPARLYGAVVARRNARYDRPGRTFRAALPVISVGNLTVGGTGKTPIVAWIATHLRSSGYRPAIVSRGYRGRAGRGPLVVSTGDGPRCAPELCGDEPFQLARTLDGVIVVVGSDRRAGAAAAKELGARAVVLDDGFQHRRLARDLDLVLLDATDPFGGGELLPAGRLREPVGALGRADFVLITRSAPGDEHPRIAETVRRCNPRATLLTAGHRPVGFVAADGRSAPPPQRAVVICGIGNPASFRGDLRRAGVEVLEFRRFGDHHRYSRAELRRWIELARDRRAAAVTTEKDLARIGPRLLELGQAEPLALRIAAEVHEPARLLEALERVCGGRR